MIDVFGLIARTVLAGIFALAGAAKLRDYEGSRRALQGFGTPTKIAGPAAIILPTTELVVGILLLPVQTANVGALFALLLLILFTAVIAINVLKGRAPQCHCFGQMHSEPVSWKTIARNLGLIGLAAVAWTGRRGRPLSFWNWIFHIDGAALLAIMSIAVVLGLSTIGLIFFLKLMRAYGRLVLRLDAIESSLSAAGIHLPKSAEVGLPPGTPVPEFALAEALTDHVITRDELFSRQLPVLLIFTSRECGACKEFLPELAEWKGSYSDRFMVVVSTGSDRDDALRDVSEFGLDDVFIDEGQKLYTTFQVNATPAGVLISKRATVESYVAVGRDAILNLLNKALASSVTLGMRVPSLELPLLRGGKATLHNFLIGRESVLLFWNPACGHCQSMKQDLRAWETHYKRREDQLVLVSSGDTASSQADGFLSPVFLDPGLLASAAFGASGTPMAIRIDSAGRVASSLVAGAKDVLDLLGGGTQSTQASVAI